MRVLSNIAARVQRPGFFGRLGIAALVLLALYLLIAFGATSIRNQKILEESQGLLERSQIRQSDLQDDLSETQEELSKAREDISELIAVNAALTEQVKRLGDNPIIAPRDDPDPDDPEPNDPEPDDPEPDDPEPDDPEPHDPGNPDPPPECEIFSILGTCVV